MNRAQRSVNGYRSAQAMRPGMEDLLSDPHPHRPGDKDNILIALEQGRQITIKYQIPVIKEHENIIIPGAKGLKRGGIHAPAIAEDDQPFVPTLILTLVQPLTFHLPPL